MTQKQVRTPTSWLKEHRNWHGEYRKSPSLIAYDAASGSFVPHEKLVAELGDDGPVNILLRWCKKALTREALTRLSEGLQTYLEWTEEHDLAHGARAGMGFDERFPSASQIKVDNYGEQPAKKPPTPGHDRSSFNARYPGAANIKLG
jgi:hypothetical protein